MTTQIETFAKTHTWQYQMDNSMGLDSWDNYSGGMKYPDWIVSVGRNRDSEILDESNFESALEMLGGESKNVVVERFGHWGCGWFELILVNPKCKKLVKVAYEIKQALNNYHILDGSDYSERETEYQSEYAKSNKKDLAKALSKHFDLKPGRTLTKLAYDLNMECQAYYGNDSCINVYGCRDPDKRDLEQLLKCMGQMGYNYKSSRVFKALKEKVVARVEVAKE